MFSTLDIIDLLSFSLGTFFGIHFILQSGKSKSFFYLGLFLLFSFTPDFIFIFLKHYQIPIGNLELATQASPYSIFLYFYTLHITKQFKKKHYRWLYPLTILLMINLSSLYFGTGIHIFIQIILSYILNIIIFFKILITIKINKKNIALNFSNTDDKDLNWLRFLSSVLILFSILWFISLISENVFSIQLYTDTWSSIATFFIIYWLGFKSIRQPEVFEYAPILTSENTEKQTAEEDDKEKDLNKEEEKIFEALQILMEDKKTYSNPNIGLRSLALQLETNEKTLSKIINLKTKNNFYHFINHYRIQKFKEILSQSPQTSLTLFGIAQELGFNSKTTFYNSFKKSEGITPGEFHKQIKSK